MSQQRGKSRQPNARPPRRARAGPPRTESSRAVALRALTRIELDGGYANLVLASVLADSTLDARDRGMVTEMVYGTTRMRRACDWLIDRFLLNELEPQVRIALRLGAYQIAFMRVPAHAAVSATVDVVPARVRGLTNAVLRRVVDNPVDAGAGPETGGWPDLATRLSYPTWIVERLVSECGEARAEQVLAAMNEPAIVHERDDGYVQDLASQQVVEVAAAKRGDVVIDLCAAPGGKSTAMATTGAHVVALDVHHTRAGLITSNADHLGLDDRVDVVVADGRSVPLRPHSAQIVLLDAPCSGLGSLRRRADARWRVSPSDIGRLAVLQRELILEAVGLVGPGGILVYSVCTLTEEETTGIDDLMATEHPEMIPEPLSEPWEPFGRGGRLLPTVGGSDGMTCYRYRAPQATLNT